MSIIALNSVNVSIEGNSAHFKYSVGTFGENLTMSLAMAITTLHDDGHHLSRVDDAMLSHHSNTLGHHQIVIFL